MNRWIKNWFNIEYCECSVYSVTSHDLFSALTDWLIFMSPTGRPSLVWAVKRRSPCMSERNMLRPHSRLCPQKRTRTSRRAQPANPNPPAAPVQRKRANQRAMPSQVTKPRPVLFWKSKITLANWWFFSVSLQKKQKLEKWSTTWTTNSMQRPQRALWPTLPLTRLKRWPENC